MAIGTYSDLISAIDDYTDRSYSTARKDIWIGNAEAKFNRRLGADYRRSTSTTLNTDANGEVSLPSGFVQMRSLTRDLAGSAPLKQVPWSALIALNPYEYSDAANWFAISGTTLKVAPITDDDFLAIYDATLSGLTSSNTTNWLLTLAPDVYLNMCLAEEALFTRDFAGAQGLAASSYDMLDDLVAMDQVAQFSNVEAVPDTAMP